MNGLNLSRYTAILLQAFTLETELQAKYKLLRSNPPNDPAEYAVLLAEIDAASVKITALWTEANALLKDSGITAAQIADAHAQIEAGHARNQKVSEDPAQTPSADIYKTVHTYKELNDIPGGAALKATGAEVGDTVRLGAGSSKVWRLFPKDAPADLRYPTAPEEPHYFLTVN